MIIGSGNIASVLTDREGAIFFASGVSNSGCTDEAKFMREKLTLVYCAALPSRITKSCIFYFSSIQAETKDTPYLRHKLQMEGIIKSRCKNYNIIRIGNIDWDTNPNTFLNFLRNKIANNEEVKILDEYRYMIDAKTLNMLCQSLPLTGQNTINAFSYMAKVKDLI